MERSGQKLILSVLMPIYNEKATLDTILTRVLAATLPSEISGIEIVAVDDGSTDGSREILKARALADPRVRPVFHEKNAGKGSAIRTAIKEARGDIGIFQDADLEYDPQEYGKVLRPIFEKGADVVYGSRFAASEYRRVLFFWHSVANNMLTLLSNILTDLNLTDMETCYKAFRMNILKTMPIRSNGFGIEPEITAKVAKRKLVVYEVPISYSGRTYAEGKKIGFEDVLVALWVMLKFKMVDDLYEERHGEVILREMEVATRFTQWLMNRLDAQLSGTILEVGAGIGNNLRALLHKEHVVATEPDLEYIHLLRNAFMGQSNVEIQQWDVTCPAPDSVVAADSILCSSVLEHIQNEQIALRNMRAVLKPSGRLVLVVPAGAWLYGSLDRELGHFRRYTKRDVEVLLSTAGFDVETVYSLNKPGVIGWWLNGKILRRKRLGKSQIKLFNALVPLFRLIDPLLPWIGLSLVVIAKRKN
jgi:glycosyltransferase involved in cell wall biosynthesis